MMNKPETDKNEKQSHPSKSQGPPLHPTLKTEHQSEVTDKTPDKAKHPTKPAQPTQPAPSRRNWFKRKIDETNLADWLMVLFTLIIAGATFAYAVYAGRQWKVMSNQLAEMKSGGQDTHDLARVALINARPWVVIEGTNFEYLTDHHVRATITLINTGPSPAWNIHGITCGQVRSNQPGIEDYRMGGPYCIERSVGMIGSHIPFTVFQGDPTQIVPQNSLAQSAHDLGSHYYVWGRIFYDVSATDKGHFTNFCLLSGPRGMQMGPCRNGNDGN